MPFGILEDKHLSDVPGTGLLSDINAVRSDVASRSEVHLLKKGTGGNAHIVLIPQPSDDPHDPLNWPRWRKEACFWTLTFAASLDASSGSLASPGYVELAKQFEVSVNSVASSFGSVMLGMGCFMLLQNVLAVKFGFRIVYLGSSFTMFVSCLWCAFSPNMKSISAATFFLGMGASPLLSLVAATIEQLYFVHERGARSQLWSLAILCGVTIGPLVSSYVLERLSWRWTYWLISIAFGLCTLLVFFFVPETTYSRKCPGGTRRSQDSINKDSNGVSKDSQELDSEKHSSVLESTQSLTYRSSLKIWNGTFSHKSVWKIFLRPFRFLLSPVMWFLFLVYGMQTVFLNILYICSSAVFTIEYEFKTSQIGLTNLGGLVGAAIGTIATSYLLDAGCVWLSKYNKGFYEPEFRIIFTLPMLFGFFGYVGWAVGNEHGMPWIGAVGCILIVNLGLMVSGSAALVYLLDTHGANALHIISLMCFFKQMISYSATFYANGLVESKGVTTSLYILAACQGVCWLATIPMYIFGKRARSFIARHPKLF